MARDTASETLATTDHDTIREWAEERDGTPSHVKGVGSDDDPGILRIDFPGYSGGDTLEPISWEEWLDKFDEADIAMIYREEEASGELSNFHKLVKRESVEDEL